MAKRSERRARREQRPTAARGTPPPAPPPAPAHRTRQFWLGALAAACLLVPVAIAAALLAGSDDDGGARTAAAAPTPDPEVSKEVERLERVTQTRDKQQVEDLTRRMRAYAGELGPVVNGLARTLPPDRENAVGPLAGRAEVARWMRATDRARAFFAETVSGDTGTNVARGAFAAAVRGLAETVRTYELALAQPAARRAVLERVRAQREVALRAWETAAVQLDAINIAAGFGHQHVPGLGAGSAPPDQLPEGTDAEE